ncbi:MAG: undecaprenyldiphospho-muramoylpentapeptide beta-N-acetylglucosaminyltransferase [Xenococcaceae cyanobacterium]
MTTKSPRLLIAASGTGGHLFPALAVAEKLPNYQIEWLGVSDRLEQTLVPDCYTLHTIPIEGFQQRFGLKTIQITIRFLTSVFQVQKIIKEKQLDAVFTTGGYIAAPAILAARLQKIPAVIHESNFIPGKVTRFLSRWCDTVALGFAGTAQYLPKVDTVHVSTPVRSQFLTSQSLDLDIPNDAPLIIVIGGSQGAVAVNKLVREAATAWFELGAIVVHLTGKNDPDVDSLQHPQYICLPFYENMAGLLQRANLAISRAGAGTLTELAVTKTPAILIPYPYAAEDHQAYNAQVFADVEAAIVYRQEQLTANILRDRVLELLQSSTQLEKMSEKTATLAITDSADRLASIINNLI